MTLTVGSLCTGIGGIDLGLERAGMRVVWQSEIDPFCCAVLARHWPGVPNLGDMREVDWTGVRAVDLLAAGFPCQPVSAAGKQRAQDDPRWLWPEVARALRHLGPRWALLENVPALLTVAGGRAAQEVFGDLADLGFDAEWFVLSAAEVGAPHLRKRVFIVAHAHGQRLPGRAQHHVEPVEPRLEAPLGNHAGGFRDDVADTDQERWRGRAGDLGPGRWAEPADGGWWAVEPGMGRVAHGVPRRVDRLRALGNAVVPQVAQVVGEWILAGGRPLLRLGVHEFGHVDGFDQRSVGEDGVHLALEQGHGGLGVGGGNGHVDVQVDEDGDSVAVHAADDDSRPPEVKGTK